MKKATFFITLSIIFLTACGTNSSSPTPTIVELSPQFIDLSIQSGNPCSPPCWYGIQAGETNYEETIDILNSISFLESDSIRERESQYWEPTLGESVDGKLLAVDYIKPEEYQALGFLIVEGIVMDFTLYLNFSISFEEVINVVGPPDYVRLFEQRGLFPGCNKQLIWIEKGIKAEHKSAVDENCNNMRLNTYVDSIDYLNDGWKQVWPLESDIPWEDYSFTE